MLSSSQHKPTIEIREINNSSPQRSNPSENTPRITINRVHSHPPIVLDRSRNRTRIQNQRSSFSDDEISINNRGKPRRCPLCATTNSNKIERNVDGNNSWRCQECGSTFN